MNTTARWRRISLYDCMRLLCGWILVFDMTAGYTISTPMPLGLGQNLLFPGMFEVMKTLVLVFSFSNYVCCIGLQACVWVACARYVLAVCVPSSCDSLNLYITRDDTSIDCLDDSLEYRLDKEEYGINELTYSLIDAHAPQSFWAYVYVWLQGYYAVEVLWEIDKLTCL